MKLLPGIRTIERSILSALAPGERAHLLDLLAKILTRTAEVAAGPPEPSTASATGPPGSTPPQDAKSRSTSCVNRAGPDTASASTDAARRP